MSILVEQQDETIDTIQAAALNVEKDTEVGYVLFELLIKSRLLTSKTQFRLKHTDKAVASARAARKKRWICFIIILIILAIVGIVVGVQVSQNTNKKSTSTTG